MATRNESKVKSITTSMEIVDAINRAETATTSELAEELDMAPSTVHNHVSTLCEHGYLVSDADGYRIGYRFLELGGRIRSQHDLYKFGRTEIDDLAQETGELANLMIEERGTGVHLYLSKGSDAVTFDTHAGKRFPLHTNALGKSILAHLPRDRVVEINERHGLEGRTDNTITEQNELFDELGEIRERGYAFDDQERIEGLRCVAAPVLIEDEVIGSVSVSGPASRIKNDRFRTELPEKVERTADIIGINIRYS